MIGPTHNEQLNIFSYEYFVVISDLGQSGIHYKIYCAINFE